MTCHSEQRDSVSEGQVRAEVLTDKEDADHESNQQSFARHVTCSHSSLQSPMASISPVAGGQTSGRDDGVRDEERVMSRQTESQRNRRYDTSRLPIGSALNDRQSATPAPRTLTVHWKACSDCRTCIGKVNGSRFCRRPDVTSRTSRRLMCFYYLLSCFKHRKRVSFIINS